MMWKYLITALALVLVIEGIMPFLCPDVWRNLLKKLILQKNQTLRVMGCCSMLLGVVILFVVHHHLL